MQTKDGPVEQLLWNLLDPWLRPMIYEFEVADDFLGAIEAIRDRSYLLDQMSKEAGETDKAKGTLANLAMTLRGRASFAERSYYQAMSHNIHAGTGHWVPWRRIRDLGPRLAYDELRQGGRDDAKDYWDDEN